LGQDITYFGLIMAMRWNPELQVSVYDSISLVVISPTRKEERKKIDVNREEK